MKLHSILIAILLLAGCAKQPAQAPIPGCNNSTDCTAARAIGDAQASIHSIKTWEVCSDSNFPSTVTFDGATANCDRTAGPFPVAFRKPLFNAEAAYNIAQAAGLAYHSGVTTNPAALTTAVANMTAAITALLNQTGSVK